jgi:hypothetical protein
MITDPAAAPHRDDLPFLRHRSLPRVRPSPAAISFDRPGRERVRPQAQSPSATAPAQSAVARVASPTAVAPVASPTAAPPPPAETTSLDLGASPRTPPPAVAVPGPVARARADARVKARSRKALTVAAPTVTLTRLQSAIGTLTFEAACSAEVGDLCIGCAYQLRTGYSSTVQRSGGNRFAPPDSRRPVLVASREHYERVEADLRQSGDLQRLVVYAFSESRAQLRWGGTLVAETVGEARVELPLDSLRGGDVAVLMSLYNVRGEFVLRAEMETLNGGVREACRAYGFDRITWLDDRTPVD